MTTNHNNVGPCSRITAGGIRSVLEILYSLYPCDLNSFQCLGGHGPWTSWRAGGHAGSVEASVHVEDVAERLRFVYYDLVVPLPARFCLGSCEFGRNGLSVGQYLEISKVKSLTTMVTIE